MSLRKPPTRTEAFLAAHRSNALKSTGPRTATGKNAIVFNSMRAGSRSPHLFETLARSSLAVQLDFARLYSALYRALAPEPEHAGWVLPTAATIWQAKRKIERKVRSLEFRSKVGNGRTPLPCRWRLYHPDRPDRPGQAGMPGWRVTVSIFVRRGRGKTGVPIWADCGTGPRPMHVGVTVFCSNGGAAERISL
ncbi:MAG TPA: hypothetical protein VGW33_08540 [Terriglobia bacterium]|nr:hypothetical protein [Terriglobia bacterium]